MTPFAGHVCAYLHSEVIRLLSILPSLHTYAHMRIYIYIERERERLNIIDRKEKIYIYIYIYMYAYALSICARSFESAVRCCVITCRKLYVGVSGVCVYFVHVYIVLWFVSLLWESPNFLFLSLGRLWVPFGFLWVALGPLWDALGCHGGRRGLPRAV